DLAAQYFLQYYLRRYITRMLELSIDNKNRKIHAVVELRGEEKPIAIDVQYDLNIDKGTDEVFIKANSITISKEWLHLIAQEVIDREFSIQGKDSTNMIQLIRNLGII
ncbi:MAG TPA: hypothetical protein VN843_33330, partial [Anaerolineales bacterium]|nr:hypothetical protein [Anaerolineales bacterium]